MKIMNYAKAFCLICLCLSLSCASDQDKHELPIVNIKGEKIANLDPKKLTDTAQIKLSQIADNIEVITLETKDESLFMSTRFIVGNEYILAMRGNQFYQFTSEGKFVRIIAKRGRGAGEIPSMGKNISYHINEKLDLLILTAGDHIYLLKLSSGELIDRKDLPDFASLKEVRAITMTSADSLFIYSYFSRGAKGDSLCSGVVVQDWNNNILWQKKFNYLTWSIDPPPFNYELLHGSDISVVDTDNPREFIFQVDNHDTCYVFNLKNFSLQPYLLRRTIGVLKDKYPIDRISQGCYTIAQEFNRTNGIHIMRMQLLTKFVDINNMDDYVYNIFYDDNNKTAINIYSFENDYFGFIHRYNGLNKARSCYL
mgnify:CR=1 FL=1|jgi:hypothetical protein